MKTLTLHQPWASLIARGVKTVETRSWAPPRALLHERFAIHAGKTLDVDSCEAWWDELGQPQGATNLPRGAVVCTAVLDGAYRSSGHFESPHWVGVYDWVHGSTRRGIVDSDEYGDFSIRRWLWVLRDIEPLEEPVKARGRQGLWEWRRHEAP